MIQKKKKQPKKRSSQRKKAKKIRRVKRRPKPGRLGRPPKVFVPEKVAELLAKGKERGFITHDEILHYFPEVERDFAGLENFYQIIQEQGVDLKEAQEFLDVEKVKNKIKKVSFEAKSDPIQLYLREIGRVSFLTGEQEKDLAKRI